MRQLPSFTEPAGCAGDAAWAPSDTLLAEGLPCLLLVEKDDAMRVMLTRMLSADYRVTAVRDGRAARLAALESVPAQVVIDLYGQGEDHRPLIRALRADGGHAPPILLLAAGLNCEMLRCCLAAGASDFLLKPFRLGQLMTCVRREYPACLQPAASPVV